MEIDNFTIVVATGAIVFVLGTLFVFMWQRDRRAPWLGWLALGYLMGALATLFLAPRGNVPNLYSMGVGTAFLLLAFGFLWVSCRVFAGRRVIWLPIIAAPTLWMSSFIITGFSEMVGVRVIVASLPAAGFLLMAARELWLNRDEGLPSYGPAIGFFVSAGFFFAFRIAAVGLLPFPIGGLDLHPAAMATFNFVIFFHAAFISFLMVSLTKERHEAAQRTLAESDVLTGLPNRRAFVSDAERLMRRQKNIHSPLALLTLDLDHFKLVNDRYGHDAGDRVLGEFAKVLTASLRYEDLRFRMGGEEFCCLLPGLTLREAHAVAERICDTFQSTAVEVLGGTVRCTVSIGISSTDICGYVLEDLLSEADAATYEAKATGRNRAVLAIAAPKVPVPQTVGKVTEIRGRRRA
ncbi:diguanylate cyclase (GGDEF) domain-containing protein [Devosia limi DSM 17137]|uniref:diguanylate cyclase n=1 Tax=Devosia limi DSM 17137 TaxID=1121477 RepID=A0A1M4VIA7_9HYPH|nr:diguanylate cyclase (GGDEF) domain-containing protein [Devosia limi DSM 17137]